MKYLSQHHTVLITCHHDLVNNIEIYLSLCVCCVCMHVCVCKVVGGGWRGDRDITGMAVEMAV